MEPVPHANTNLRRAPVQQRSAERLARILDACAELLDETGYEQLSTRAVALRAGVPIGSVYRFFSNKRALTDALAQRNLDSYAERITGRLAVIPATDWRSAIDAVLDEYLAMKRSVAGFALVDFGAVAPEEDPANAANQRVATASPNCSPHIWAAPPTRICRAPSWSASRPPTPSSNSPSAPTRRATGPSSPRPASCCGPIWHAYWSDGGGAYHLLRAIRDPRVDLGFCSYCSHVNVLLTLRVAP